jgi:hypothetical protein
MTSARSTTRRLVLVTAAVATFGVAAPAQSADAQPKPGVQQQSVGLDRHKHHDTPPNCADAVGDLTDALRQAGLSGQASHVAAQLTLGC